MIKIISFVDSFKHYEEPIKEFQKRMWKEIELVKLKPIKNWNIIEKETDILIDLLTKENWFKIVLNPNWKNIWTEDFYDLIELKKQKYKLKTVRAMQMKEAFQDIYLALTKEEFQLGFKHWISWAKRSRLEPMKKAAKSIQKHWDGVMKWFDTRLSNGLIHV